MHPCRVSGAPPKEPLPDWLTSTGPLTDLEVTLLLLELLGIMLFVEFPRVVRLRLSLTHRPARIRGRSNAPLPQGRTFRRPESIDRSPPPWRRWRFGRPDAGGRALYATSFPYNESSCHRHTRCNHKQNALHLRRALFYLYTSRLTSPWGDGATRGKLPVKEGSRELAPPRSPHANSGTPSKSRAFPPPNSPPLY